MARATKFQYEAQQVQPFGRSTTEAELRLVRILRRADSRMRDVEAFIRINGNLLCLAPWWHLRSTVSTKAEMLRLVIAGPAV